VAAASFVTDTICTLLLLLPLPLLLLLLPSLLLQLGRPEPAAP
jgi:hypothetical protein